MQIVLAVVIGATLLSDEATSRQASQLEVPFFKEPILTMGWGALAFLLWC
ncbi:MAG: hypothetical protein R3F23_03545 [Verrucomicrobiia bacterium]